MKFFESVALALSAILAHKLRSFLTLLGIIFGVATVIVVVSLIEGRSRDESLRRACAAGALAASRFGAQTSLPTAEEVDELL